MMNNKIIQFGPMPPPLGGVSVYLYRLNKIRKNDVFINELKVNKFAYIQLVLRCFKCHYIFHSINLKKICFLHFLSYFNKNQYSIVLHGNTFFHNYEKANFLKKFAYRRVLSKCKMIQVVNEHIKCSLIKIYPDSEDKIIVKNAFLPPPIEDEERILNTYPEDLFVFRKKHHPIIVANAFKLVFWDGIDLYGLDMCIDIIAKLQKKYPNIGLIFALAADENQIYLNRIKEQIEVLQIKDNVFFLTGQKELWPLFKNANLMIRPTCTDGYGVSVKEALFFGCQAIASDVCQRPEGTILFKNRDENDLYLKCITCLNNVERKK